MFILQEKRNTNYLFLTFIAVYAFAMAFFVNKVSNEDMTSLGSSSYFVAGITENK